MFKRTLCVLALVLVAVAGSVSAQDSIRIGAIFDLSGETETVSRPYAEGVAAYIEFVNANGGINGVPLELRAADFGGDRDLAHRAYVQFASEGMTAFIGWGTEEMTTLANRAATDEIPVISAAYSDRLNDPTGDAPYTFVLGTTYGDQITIMMAYMATQWQRAGGNPADMSIAIFHDDSEFGTDPLNAASDAASRLRIGGVLAVEMRRGATDFTAELQQADDYGVTHIIIQSTPEPAAIVARNVADFWGQGRVVVGCLNWCANEQFISNAGNAAEGVLGTQPFAPTSVRVTGQADATAALTAQGLTLQTASLHFTEGWATAEILVSAIQNVADAGRPITGENVRLALESLSDIETGDLLAPVTLTPNDHRGTRAVTVYQVTSGRWQAASDLVDLR